MTIGKAHTVRILLSTVIFWAWNTVLLAQGGSDCKSIFTKAFNNFRSPSDEGYALSYSVESTLVSDEVNKEEIEIRMNQSRVFIKTSMSKVYKDDQATVMIDDNRKLIFITKEANESLMKLRLDNMALMQDSLLSSTSRLTCESDVSETGGLFTVITLGPENKIIESMGLQELNYWVDQSTGQIKKMDVAYASENPQLKRMVMRFYEFNKTFSGEAFSGAALAQVYIDSGKVRDIYAKYKVVNNLIN